MYNLHPLVQLFFVPFKQNGDINLTAMMIYTVVVFFIIFYKELR